MYETFFGLRELPFELTSNPRYLFLTRKHREGLGVLKYGISARKGITLLLGDAGTGKTTLIRAATEAERRTGATCLYLNNPMLTRSEFVEFLARGFNLSSGAAVSKAACLDELEQKLLVGRDEEVTTLIIDEAQGLTNELLEEVRLLANIETDSVKLLPIVLVGQPELAEQLNDPALRALKQRIGLRCVLPALDLHETAAYIAARIRVAGGDCARVFTREAVTLIHERSRGIPRTISVICDNALLTGFAMDRRPVGYDVVREVCADFDLAGVAAGGPGGPASSGPSARKNASLLTARPEAAQDASGIDALQAVAVEPGTAPRRRRFSFFGRAFV